ncbi:hypothetical protein CSHISOI_09997 [Colletotrichum shisoi]|uniref:Ecp2 effector protein domain-containing protein n=1 Tax=Colletotrichum shisoi TaxID=2078593 RepID=A0A5Q4BFQ1_9PEZI|nr:hypothetical protein CSHISOI_09997 [Colletotrichum shisoi]
MRTNSAATVALSFATFAAPVLCNLATIIRIPECASNGHGTAKNIWETKADRCQAAILSLYGRGNDTITAPRAGCKRIVSVDPCSVWLCAGDVGSQGTISAGALATAAQDIHSFCRLNENAGGRVFVAAPGGKPDGTVVVQLGEIHKDELKLARREEPSRVQGDEAAGYDESERREMDLRRRNRLSRGKRSDPEELGPAEGVNEGEEMILNEVETGNIAADFLQDIQPVRDVNNPNWQNTAQVERTYNTNSGPIAISMGFLGRNGRTARDLGLRDVEINDLVMEIIGNWYERGLRSLFSVHVFRRFRNGGQPDVPLGEVAIVIERGNRGGNLLPVQGSQ